MEIPVYKLVKAWKKTLFIIYVHVVQALRFKTVRSDKDRSGSVENSLSVMRPHFGSWQYRRAAACKVFVVSSSNTFLQVVSSMAVELLS